MVEVELLRGPEDGRVLQLPTPTAWLEVPSMNDYGRFLLVYRATNRFSLEARRLYEYEGVREPQP